MRRPEPYTIVWHSPAYPGIFRPDGQAAHRGQETSDQTDFTKKGTGTGPFIFDRSVPESTRSLKRNRTTGARDSRTWTRIRVTPVPDVTPCDAIGSRRHRRGLRPPLVEAVRLKSNPKFKVDSGMIRSLFDILLFTKKGPS